MAATIAAMDAAGVATALIFLCVAPRNAMPARVQPEPIENVRPTVPVGMPSFALHMANIADAAVKDFEKFMKAPRFVDRRVQGSGRPGRNGSAGRAARGGPGAEIFRRNDEIVPVRISAGSK